MGQDEFEQAEYFAVTASIAEFDQRLLTIKGWGVTLSLAALGFGFQYRAYGFFLIAAASSLAFWVTEAVTKRHQMRHYVRTREIELNRFEQAAAKDKKYSSPRIDWSWKTARKIYTGEDTKDRTDVKALGKSMAYRGAFLLPHVALPHAITFFIGAALFLLGQTHHLAYFTLGAMPSK